MKKQAALFSLLLLLVSCTAPLSSLSSETSDSFLASLSPESSVTDFTFQDGELTENLIDDNYRSFYQIFVGSYADSNGDHLGDLNGIDQKLGYLHDIGYTGIWLSPIYSSLSYHKYDTNDYFKVDSGFGTNDDLKKLVQDAHALGIKVILDIALNHSGYNNPWFASALLAHIKKLKGDTLSEDEQNFDSLYVFYDTLEAAKASGSVYSKAGGNDFYYECNFSSDMPEFNFDSAFTYAKMKEILSFWMDLGVDGYRLDAVKYYYLNQTAKNLTVLNAFAADVKEKNPQGYLVGECWDSSSVISDYYGSDIDSFFYFPGSQPNGYIAYSMGGFDGSSKDVYLRGETKMISAAKSHIPAPFLDNHDMPRMTKAKDSQMTKFQLGLRDFLTGAVYNYYGDETGLSSANNPGGDYADSNYRCHYCWDDTTHAMECYDPQYANPQTEYYPAAMTQLTDENSVLSYETKALKIRNAYPAISHGSVASGDDARNDDDSDPLLILDKTYDGKTVRLVYNFSLSVSSAYSVPDSYTPKAVLLSDTAAKATYQDHALTLPPYAIAVLEPSR
jgi:alpha-amylase